MRCRGARWGGGPGGGHQRQDTVAPGGIGDKLARLNTNAAVHYCTVITHCIIVVLAILHSTDFTLKHSRIYERTIVGLISNFATDSIKFI